MDKDAISVVILGGLFITAGLCGISLEIKAFARGLYKKVIKNKTTGGLISSSIIIVIALSLILIGAYICIAMVIQ